MNFCSWNIYVCLPWRVSMLRRWPLPRLVSYHCCPVPRTARSLEDWSRSRNSRSHSRRPRDPFLVCTLSADRLQRFIVFIFKELHFAFSALTSRPFSRRILVSQLPLVFIIHLFPEEKLWGYRVRATGFYGPTALLVTQPTVSQH